jgi:GT2 family glycosyltransferase
MPEATAPVSVLIVSYNTRELLRRCLRSLDEAIGSSDHEVIVLDNASSDGSADMVAEAFPAVTLVRSSTNLGFAAGVNEAARRATRNHLLLLNPDTELRPGAVDALLDAKARHPEVGLIGGRTLTPEGSLDRRSCWGLPTAWSTFCFGTGLSAAFAGSSVFDPETLGSWPRDTERRVGAVSGALLFIDRKLWLALDGFDEDYFMYSEDIDLASRALARGRPAMLTPDAVATHVVGASSRDSADKMVLVMAGKATYFRKNMSPLSRRWALAMLWLGTALRGVAQSRLGRRSGNRDWAALWRCRHDWLPGYQGGQRRSVTVP